MNFSKISSLLVLLGTFLLPSTAFSQSITTSDPAHVINVGETYTFDSAATLGVLLGATGSIDDTYQFNLGSGVTGIKVEFAEGFNISDVVLSNALVNGFSQAVSVGGEFLFSAAEGATTMQVIGSLSNPFAGDYVAKVSAVPLPAAFWMFGSALMGLLAFARRRNQHASYA